MVPIGVAGRLQRSGAGDARPLGRYFWAVKTSTFTAVHRAPVRLQFVLSADVKFLICRQRQP